MANPGDNILRLFGASPHEWADWRWQLQHSIRDLIGLRDSFMRVAGVTPESLGFDANDANPLQIKLTPHVFANIAQSLAKNGPNSIGPLLATYVPTVKEQVEFASPTQVDDGRGELEREANPVRSIINFFHNRVLLMVDSTCAAYCRYCFRRSVIGDGVTFYNRGLVGEGIEYIRAHPEISEVILSGGDPLVLEDGPLDEILGALRRIPHVRSLRIDTKAITSLPQRFTPELCELLRRHSPLYVMGNFLHAGEVSDETSEACERLVDNGIPVFAHTALLRGINDDLESLKDLFETLICVRVKPYYLIHFIPTRWTEHFRVSIEEGLKLFDQLHSKAWGIALPTYIIYLPEGRGKVPILPQFLIRKEGGKYYFRSFDGREVCYRDGAYDRLSIN